MKKLVLLGDSIRLAGYGNAVAERLADKFVTWQPEDNCRFSKYLLRTIFDNRANLEGADVIHFNCGLWDICKLYNDNQPFTPIDEYKKDLVRIAAELKKYGKTIIFSTTTPCPEGNPYNDDAVIQEFNAAATEILTPMGVIINDLHSVIAADMKRYINQNDLLHLSEDGAKVATESVLSAILANS